MKNEKRGFTLIELLVVVMIIGILAAIGIPQYFRTVEVSKANDAVPLVVMAGNADRMYALDHAANYVQSGYIPAGNCAGNTCRGASGGYPLCDLIACGYMANDDYNRKPYVLTIGNCVGGYCSPVATVNRLPSASSPYNGWGYTVDSNGVVTAFGSGVPPPPQ